MTVAALVAKQDAAFVAFTVYEPVAMTVYTLEFAAFRFVPSLYQVYVYVPAGLAVAVNCSEPPVKVNVVPSAILTVGKGEIVTVEVAEFAAQ
jgi:hypothetical protein